MGLAPIASMVALAFLAIFLVGGMLMMASDYSKSDVELKQMEDRLQPFMKSDIAWSGFNTTNTSTTNLNVTLYITNTGSTNMGVDCVDVFIDNMWINSTDIDAVPRPLAFDPMLWGPSEELQLSINITLDVGEHNATVISCDGKKTSGIFNASKCSDGVCTGGEYCDADNSTCPDTICHEPRCWDGCIEIPIIDDYDLSECDSDDAAQNCQGGPCWCGMDSVCCGITNAPCIHDGHCCDGWDCVGVQCKPVGERFMRIPTQSCAQADRELNPYTFPDSCDGNYPGDCGGDDRLRCQDGDEERPQADLDEWCGVEAEYYNSTDNNCTRIEKVEVCHELWLESTQGADCNISISQDGVSWEIINTTCNLVQGPGAMCQDVTGVFSWDCSDFFSTSGSYIRYNMQEKEDSSERCPADELVYDVTYIIPTTTTTTTLADITQRIPTQTCDAAIEEVNPNSFPDACDGKYPGPCGDDDRLLCDDNNREESDADDTEYCGLKAKYYNSSVSRCQSINSVLFCHETWIETNPPDSQDCDISVSRDGSSWTEINTTCIRDKDPGILCQNVTNTLSWDCDDFFTSDGVYSRFNAQSLAGGKKCKTDVFYYEVDYVTG